MTSNTSFFVQLLEQELDCLSQITKQLNQEQVAIVDGNLEQLETLQPQKNTLLKQLQQQANERLQWMQEQQLPLSNDCLNHFSVDDAKLLSPIWKNLEAEYQHNQILSAKLSEIVLILRHKTQSQIKILFGQLNDNSVYNQQGKENSVGLGRHSVQA